MGYKRAIICFLLVTIILTMVGSVSLADSDKLLASEYAMFDLYRGARTIKSGVGCRPDRVIGIWNIFK